ncbi:hypothetical protein OQA88_8544 [Cercophora sp. LCS_1]
MRPFLVSVSLFSSVRTTLALAVITPPVTITDALAPTLVHRQAVTGFSTCGYVDGDPSKPRIAPNGFNCRVDTLNGLWGFCPTSVMAATDCGLGGFCFDGGPCSTGCGRSSLRNNPKIRTWTCPEADDEPGARFCSTASLVFGPDQTYDYVDCARNPGKAIYFFSPTAALATPTPTPASPSPRSLFSTSAVPIPCSSSSTALSSSSATGSGLANASPNTSTPAQEGGGAPSTGAIVGGALGGLALLSGSVIVVVYILRNNLSRRSDPPPEEALHLPQRTPSSAQHALTDKWQGWVPEELESVRPPGELPAYDPGRRKTQFAELSGDSYG